MEQLFGSGGFGCASLYGFADCAPLTDMLKAAWPSIRREK